MKPQTLHYKSFVRESTGDLWITFTKDQSCGKGWFIELLLFLHATARIWTSLNKDSLVHCMYFSWNTSLRTHVHVRIYIYMYIIFTDVIILYFKLRTFICSDIRSSVCLVCMSPQWHRNDHQPHDCLLNRLFRRRSNKTSKLYVTGLCTWNSPVTGEFPAQRAGNAERFPFDDVIILHPGPSIRMDLPDYKQ